jgi:hypothetical protein
MSTKVENAHERSSSYHQSAPKLNEEYSVVHPHYPTVMMINGVVTSLTCGRCGANEFRRSSIEGVIFYAGLRGLKAHTRKAHALGSLTNAECVSNCEKAVLGTTHSTLLRAVQAHITPIPVISSTDVQASFLMDTSMDATMQ